MYSEDLVDTNLREVACPLKLNGKFASNIVKHAQDNNRIRTDIQLRQQRKFINEERKKHTKKNLGPVNNMSKTMYSDYVSERLEEKTKIKDTKMFNQMKKLVKEAAEFDQAMSRKEIQSLSQQYLPQRKSKISIDKTLLHNHLQHTSVHNRLKEESQMWEKFSKDKKRFNNHPTRRNNHSTRKNTNTGSSMYADLEPGPSVTVQIDTEDNDYVKCGERRKVGMYTDEVKRTERPEKHQRVENECSSSAIKKGGIVRKVILQTDRNVHQTSRKRKSFETKETSSSNKISDRWDHDGFFALTDTKSITKEEPTIMSRVVETYRKRPKDSIGKEIYVLSSSSDLSSDSSGTDDERDRKTQRSHKKKRARKNEKLKNTFSDYDSDFKQKIRKR